MAMNKQKGNMYGFVTHTINYIKGKCPHNCKYCYMISIWQRVNSKEQRFDENELKTNLGSDNFIFVGSSTDMFANTVDNKWIQKVLNHCKNYPKNKYLFQTKNPERFKYFDFPKNAIFGTTIETNRDYDISNAPDVAVRKHWLSQLDSNKMVSIEPIMDFDVGIMRRWMIEIEPKFVSIGADSKGHGLKEPSWDKVQKLIKELEQFTEVRIKDNLKRLKK